MFRNRTSSRIAGIVPSPEGGITLVGTSRGPESSDMDGWVTKLDAGSDDLRADGTSVTTAGVPSFDPRLVGQWRGGVAQPGAKPYSTTMSIVAPATSGACGKIDYPELGCGGALVGCQPQHDGSVHMTELLSYGRDRCALEGKVIAALNGKALSWVWLYPDGRHGGAAILNHSTETVSTINTAPEPDITRNPFYVSSFVDENGRQWLVHFVVDSLAKARQLYADPYFLEGKTIAAKAWFQRKIGRNRSLFRVYIKHEKDRDGPWHLLGEPDPGEETGTFFVLIDDYAYKAGMGYNTIGNVKEIRQMSLEFSDMQVPVLEFLSGWEAIKTRKN